MITPEQMQILEQQPDVAENMERYGGSFIQNIGRALLHADFINAEKIYKTWPVEWEFYLNFTKTRGVKKCTTN